MRELIDRLSAHIHWVVFLLLETLSGFLLFQFNHYQGSVWLTQANTVAGRVMEWEAAALSYIHLGGENERLTRRNVALQRELDVLRHQLAASRRDTSLTERAQRGALSGVELVAAKVIANSVSQKDNFLTIDAGSADGVRPEMGVVSGTGVVGIVSQVTSRHALVMSALNSRSSISCRLRGTEYFGCMKWRGGSPLRAYMDDVPRHARTRVGDAVETSGYSSVFPAGLFLGRVARVSNSEDGLSYQLEIQLSTDLARVRDVFVVRRDDREELDSLLER